MSTPADRTRLRRKIGDHQGTVFTDTELDDIFAEASSLYADSDLLFAKAKVIAIEELMTDAAKLVNYRQNHSSEDLSDTFSHLRLLRTVFEQDLVEMVKTKRGPSARLLDLRE